VGVFGLTKTERGCAPFGVAIRGVPGGDAAVLQESEAGQPAPPRLPEPSSEDERHRCRVRLTGGGCGVDDHARGTGEPEPGVAGGLEQVGPWEDDDAWDGEPEWLTSAESATRLLGQLPADRSVKQYVSMEAGVRTVTSPTIQIARSGGVFVGSVTYELFPKWWEGTLGARAYLRLMYQSALSYQAGGGPVAQVHIDDSDDVMIYASYTVLLNALDSSSTVVMALQAVNGLFVMKRGGRDRHVVRAWA